MIEIGQIIEVSGKKALVRIERHSLCSKCTNNCHLAGDSHERDEFEVVVDNSLGARKGQLVKLEMSEESLVVASLIIYLIPLIGIILGYFIGAYLAAVIGLDNREISGIIGSVSFLVFSFLVVRYLDRVMGKETRYQPQLIEIVDNK